MAWPAVVLLLGSGLLVVLWRATSLLSTKALTERVTRLEGLSETRASQLDLAALNSDMTSLVGRVMHLEAMQPELEAQRRTRRFG